ncbi:MAG: capsid cement protein [Phenylobacterium sp.]|uniref:capsid cement protein n=1 Tax=Phenylobacterium sp. TaxID=1871053 RepID=UPI003918E8C1
MRTNPAMPYTAGAAVAPRRIVKFGAADGVVVQSAAATDLSIGVSDSLGAAAAGDGCEVYTSGQGVEIDVGGNITRGQKIVADANGKAVAAAPAQGANVQIVGFANASYVAGDIGEFHLAPSVMQGA